MAARWTLRSYQGFLRAAQARHGINYREAQALYRGMKGALGGKKLYASALTNHPRIAKQVLVTQVLDKKTLDTLRDLDRLIDADIEYEQEDYSSSADY